MMDRLPPLTALRAFDAAARHMSFAKAAAELHVTPAALSFQIKSLETHLGQPVFRRLNRAVELTEAGRALAPGLQSAFEEMSSAWRAAVRVTDQTTLNVTAGPAFTAKWLAPRLFLFAKDHPDIELRFSATLRLLDFDRDDVDLAIRFGQSPDVGLYSKTLIDEWMTPMVSPDLAAGLRTPADLAKLPLLHQDDTAYLEPRRDWAAWFRGVGLPMPDGKGSQFSQADHAVDAALAGAGAVLGRISLTERHLAEGQLVMPFAQTLKANATYRIVGPDGAASRPHAARFIAFVEQQVRSIGPLVEGRVFVDEVADRL